MTLKDQRRWLKTRQRWAQARLHDAEVMIVGAGEVDRAREDLAATTALLTTLDSMETQQLSLYGERTPAWPHQPPP